MLAVTAGEGAALAFGQRTHLLYRLVQNAEEDWGRSLWSIIGYKAGYISRKTYNSFLGRVICYLGLLHDFKMNVRSETYINISSDSQAALSALQLLKQRTL